LKTFATAEPVCGQCTICASVEDVRHLPLYVIGSEGLQVCHTCEMDLVTHVRSLMHLAAVSRKTGYKACKEIREAKEAQKEREHSVGN